MLEFNFSPFPVLTTKRLLLRELTLNDAPELFFLRSDETVLKYVGREPAKSVEEVYNFIEMIRRAVNNNESIFWAIAWADEPDKLIGSICFWQLQPENYRAEIGYNLHPDHWGKGIITEAIETVLQYGFENMNLHSIEARTHPGNTGSTRSLEKNGFVKEGQLREDFYFNGQFHDTLIYSKLKSS